MGSTKDLSPHTIAQIIALQKGGNAMKQIAEIVGVSSLSVRCWVAKFNREVAVTTPTQKKRTGRKQKTAIGL